jgi:4-hydroxy-tetrahydrodipicolinate reductase
MSRLRVIQWAPGLVGKQTLRGILDHPELELVGLWVHSPDKAGHDAAAFCGADPTGVISSADPDAVLNIDADCVVYTATDLRRHPSELVDDISRILRTGKNVVGVQASMNYPQLLGPELEQRLQDACREGNSSYYPTGINANGSQTVLASVASMCQRVESTYLCEMYNFETYEDPQVFEYFGYGLSPDEAELHDLRPLFEYLFGPALHLTASWFGLQLDEVRWDQEYALSERDVDAPLFSLKAGTVSAIRFNLDGFVDGKCRVTQGGAYWLGDYPSAWEPPPGEGGYRLAVKGEPDMQLQWSTRTKEESFKGPLAKARNAADLAIMGGLMATAARAVNSVPALCGSAPGIQTLADQNVMLRPVDWRSGGAGDTVGAVFAGARPAHRSASD